MELGVNENKLILNGKFLLVCVVPFSFYSVNLPDLSLPILFQEEEIGLTLPVLRAKGISCLLCTLVLNLSIFPQSFSMSPKVYKVNVAFFLC